ncbi:MAG: N-acetylmuramoyl-L-alanine amidase [Oscillospiraceae bacterium]|nr:N-acetylmuramoyl-L-alanine amidase [Oscillospiraceae bacterium]
MKLHSSPASKANPITRILCVLLVLVCIVSAFVLTVSAGDSQAQLLTAVCDMNGDSVIAAADARILLRVSAKLQDLAPTAASKAMKVKVFGDLDADSRIAAADARLLLRVSAKIEDLSGILPYLIEGAEIPGDSELDKLLVPNTLLSPYQNHGLGQARMCEVVDNDVETMPSGVDNDKSHPKYSPLVKGTVDYVTGFEMFDSRHFTLQSGRKIAEKNGNGTIRYASLIESGYKMPVNTLKGMTAVTGERSTDIYVRTNWIVPVNVTFEPQSYYTGYDSRPWNLSSFTAEYMDIVFYYSGSAQGPLVFGPGSVISRGEWIQNAGKTTVTLRLYFRQKGAFFGYDITMTDMGYFKLSLKHKSLSLSGKVVVLDAGHGAEDPGAVSKVDGVTGEKWITLAIASEAARILRQRGATVHMTRTGDTNPTLRERTDLVREKNPDASVSIHLDSSTSSSTYGTHVFYYYPYAMPFAQILQDSLVSAYKNKVYAGNSARQNSNLGIKFYPFNFARVENCPSVLIEVGFLSNATELAALKKTENQNTLAAAIADGITKFLGGAASSGSGSAG